MKKTTLLTFALIAITFASCQLKKDRVCTCTEVDGYVESNLGTLPPILSALDRDILYEVNDQRLTFLIDHKLDSNYCAASISGVDIHIMNKQSIIRNQQRLLEMI